jgi:hypothetical protein
MMMPRMMEYLPFAFAACVVAVVIGGYIKSLQRALDEKEIRAERVRRYG